MVHLAPATGPPGASELGEVSRPVTSLPSADPSGGRNHLGVRNASRIPGRAGWWKSPCPDLVRASAGQPAEATRQEFESSGSFPLGCRTPPERMGAPTSAGPADSYGGDARDCQELPSFIVSLHPTYPFSMSPAPSDATTLSPKRLRAQL